MLKTLVHQAEGLNECLFTENFRGTTAFPVAFLCLYYVFKQGIMQTI